jgi:cellulose binding protein with CBM2 domain/fibronectin type III domain protein
MRLRGQLFVAGVAIGTAVVITAVTMPGAQAGTGPARLAAPSGTISDVIGSPSPSRSLGNPSPLPPGPPGNLTATRVTTNSVTLTWTPPATPGCCGVAGYQITYRQVFNDIIWAQNLDNVTTVTINQNIAPTRQYTFYVTAHDSLGHTSGISNQIEVMTPVSDTGDTTPPPAPGNLSLSNATPTSVQLAWTAPADTTDVAGYNVYGFDGLFASPLLGTTTGTTFTAPNTPTFYRFYVRSRDAAGNLSLATNVVTSSPGSGSLPPSSSGSSSSPPVAPPSCRVSYAQTTWPGGFVANLSITNTGDTTINGWTLAFNFMGDQQITGTWGGTATQSGSAVTVRNAPWDGVVGQLGTVYLGVQGSWHSSAGPAGGFTVNGVTCAVR